MLAGKMYFQDPESSVLTMSEAFGSKAKRSSYKTYTSVPLSSGPKISDESFGPI